MTRLSFFLWWLYPPYDVNVYWLIVGDTSLQDVGDNLSFIHKWQRGCPRMKFWNFILWDSWSVLTFRLFAPVWRAILLPLTNPFPRCCISVVKKGSGLIVPTMMEMEHLQTVHTTSGCWLHLLWTCLATQESVAYCQTCWKKPRFPSPIRQKTPS